MPRGNTAAINVESLRVQWAAHIPIARLCQNFTVSRDQMTRLKFVLELPPRHDRSLRFKPPRPKPPTPEEIAASEASLSFAPAIAAAVTCVQVTWDARTREERQVTKPTAFSLRRIELNDELRDEIDDERW
jgi:hypothetical protein